MSAVAHPFPHAPFRDPSTDVFAPSGAATSLAEFPPPLPLSTPPSLPMRAPFPMFQHRHTSPYPMSFSALGAPTPDEITQPLHSVSPPPAPKMDPAPLPRLGTDTSPHERRRHRPEAMVKLAPPADDGYETVRIVQVDEETETPRRSPVLEVNLNNLDYSPNSGIGRSNSEGKRKKRSETDLSKRRTMGPPPRPVRANTSYPISSPSSVRMEGSRSTDSRARSRAAMPIRTHSSSPYAVPFPTGSRS